MKPPARRPMTFARPGGLIDDDRRNRRCEDAQDPAARRNAQGAVRARERRPARLERARPVLRELARLPGQVRPRVGDDLRRRGERVARLGDLAEPRSRRDLGALERGPRLRRGRRRRAQALEGLVGDARARPPARRRRVGGPVREHRRRQDVLARLDARGPGGPRGLERPGAAAARPSRAVGDHPAPGRGRPLLDHRPGLQPVRDDRPREDLDAAQQGPAPGLAGRVRGDRLLRPQGRADLRLRALLPAEPRRHAPLRRRGQDVDGDHRGPADRLRLRGRRAPARPRQLLRDPARRGPRPHDARRAGGGLAHARRRVELAEAHERPAAAERVRRRAPRGHDGRPRRLARPLLRHEHRPGVLVDGRGRELERDRRLPARDLVGLGGDGR